MKYPEDMDKECIEICDFFNKYGLKTEYSCCGHGTREFYIRFNRKIKFEDINSFLFSLNEREGCFPLYGRFVLNIGILNGEYWSVCDYVADSYEEALVDYKYALNKLEGENNEI